MIAQSNLSKCRQRAEAGLCQACGCRPPLPGVAKCHPCRSREYERLRGVCRYCGKGCRAEDKRYCPACRVGLAVVSSRKDKDTPTVLPSKFLGDTAAYERHMARLQQRAEAGVPLFDDDQATSED